MHGAVPKTQEKATSGATAIRRNHVAASQPEHSEQRLPAVIFVDHAGAGLEIAGLTVLDRLIVAVHRGGAGPITLVLNGTLPALRRAPALGIPMSVCSQAPALAGPCLLAQANVLVQADDIHRCLQRKAGLAASDGARLPLGVSAAADPAELLSRHRETLPPLGVACLVEDPGSAQAAARALWQSLTSRSDGVVDKVFNRPCGRPLSKWLVHTPVSPNLVSVFSIAIGVTAAGLFARGDYLSGLLGAILFQLSAIIDCVDGDLARVLFKESRFGKWLDLAGDQIVHVTVFGGLAWGVARAGGTQSVLWLGLSAMIGALISFGVVVRGMRRQSSQGRLRRLIDATTNRDFSVLVFMLALFQELDVFLWLAGIGSHLFWVAALGLQFQRRESSRSGS